jgi:hypothetical protein
VHEIPLTGVDGSNLLGFLCGLGTLRLLDAKLSWCENVSWTPVLHHAALDSEDAVVAELTRLACGPDRINPAWRIADDLTLKRCEFRQVLVRSVSAASPRNRDETDFLASFGTEIHGSGPGDQQMSDSAFCTMRGAGHQHFLGFMRKLAEQTGAGHIDAALFKRWDYNDGRPSMRWDASDYRPHALRALDPSTDPIRTMRGANLLAVHALPFFPTVPEADDVGTTGFADFGSGVEFTWPLWTEPLSAPVVSSLLASEDLLTATKLLRRRGVAQVFRARRFTEGKYRNFSPARALI